MSLATFRFSNLEPFRHEKCEHFAFDVITRPLSNITREEHYLLFSTQQFCENNKKGFGPLCCGA